MDEYSDNDCKRTTSSQNSTYQKPACKGLGPLLKIERRSNLKKARRPNHYKSIPESIYLSLVGLGRAKYRAIVVVTIMCLLWDGWTSKKKTNRRPSNKVVATRRMFAQHFDFCPSTAQLAIKDLNKRGIIDVAQESVFSGKQGKNRGRLYRIPCMENPKGRRLKIYWGLLVSDSFLRLDLTLKAVIILLHRYHDRTKNRLTIRPHALEEFGIHRNRLPGYVCKLRNAGLLAYIEDRDYEFTWIDRDGDLNFNRIKKISMHLSRTDSTPNSCQGI